MIEFIIDVSINFITFAICFIPLHLSEKNKGTLEKIVQAYFLRGL